MKDEKFYMKKNKELVEKMECGDVLFMIFEDEMMDKIIKTQYFEDEVYIIGGFMFRFIKMVFTTGIM